MAKYGCQQPQILQLGAGGSWMVRNIAIWRLWTKLRGFVRVQRGALEYRQHQFREDTSLRVGRDGLWVEFMRWTGRLEQKNRRFPL